ncbi:hypothetical protein ABZ318_37330 [Streptomyces sp. NPDC006197]|uniref:hypothetical protein n=1 Tax=Streptomyces sp. NPDC006197 TaxID=3156685 RepID=UPI00339E0951
MSTRTLVRGGLAVTAVDELRARYAEADGDRAIDHAFPMPLSDVNEHTREETGTVVQEGITREGNFGK